ncbi:hypothetical protein BJ165DRAFT_1596014 [Panaeolus papilionaceus]|nr:hypothetical protein BJ165DRAFT_1596014 [Panaeolus papilionaceus]
MSDPPNNSNSAASQPASAPTPKPAQVAQPATAGGNILIAICGPAVPLPIDKEYYLFPKHLDNDSPFDHTFQVIQNDSVVQFSHEHPAAGKNSRLFNEAHLYDIMPLIGSSVSSSHSWDAAKDYSYGIDYPRMYTFVVDCANWPIPDEKFVTPSSVDTISRVG